MKLNYFLLRKEYRQEVQEAVEKILSDYPVLEQDVKIVHVKKLAKDLRYSFASAKILWKRRLQWEIKLNPLAFAVSGIGWKILSTTGANIMSIQDIIVHEFGHCLQMYMPCVKCGLNIKEYSFRKWKIYYMAIEEYAKEYYKEFFEQMYEAFSWSEEDVRVHLGCHAVENPLETFPECFSNYYRLRDQYPYLNEKECETYEFTKYVIEAYNQYIPHSK